MSVQHTHRHTVNQGFKPLHVELNIDCFVALRSKVTPDRERDRVRVRETWNGVGQMKWLRNRGWFSNWEAERNGDRQTEMGSTWPERNRRKRNSTATAARCVCVCVCMDVCVCLHTHTHTHKHVDPKTHTFQGCFSYTHSVFWRSPSYSQALQKTSSSLKPNGV